MPRHLYLITGASRGMGLAMAQQLLSAEHTLLCISRHRNDDLANQARALGCALEQWPLDLAHGVQAAARLRQWLAALAANSFASATLISNAGVLPDIAPLSASDPLDLAHALRVGLEAPMVIAATFLAATQGWGVARKILNISSGLGRRAMASQAAYCAAKAGMDHFTRCLALDEVLKVNGAKVCSLAPGVIDTDMQLQLRETTGSVFPDQEFFANLKQSAQLTAPADAAR